MVINISTYISAGRHTREACSISTKCPSRPKPVTSVQAVQPWRRSTSAARAFDCCMLCRAPTERSSHVPSQLIVADFLLCVDQSPLGIALPMYFNACCDECMEHERMSSGVRDSGRHACSMKRVSGILLSDWEANLGQSAQMWTAAWQLPGGCQCRQPSSV